MKKPSNREVQARKDLLDSMEKVERYASRMVRQSEAIREIAEPEESSSELFSLDSERRTGRTEFVRAALRNIRSDLFHAYWALTGVNFIDAPYFAKGQVEAACNAENQESKVFDSVAVKVLKRCVFVKMPLLWSRYSYAKLGNKSLPSTDSLSWFDRELNAAFNAVADTLPVLQERHITYLHVVPLTERQPVDNDNYDTKHITDIIAGHLGSSDVCFSTSFSYMSIREGALPSGTYIVVTPEVGVPPPIASIVTQLKKAFFASKK